MRVWSTLGVVLMATVLTAPQATTAQEREAETLITGGIDSGGFGGPVLKFAERSLRKNLDDGVSLRESGLLLTLRLL